MRREALCELACPIRFDVDCRHQPGFRQRSHGESVAAADTAATGEHDPNLARRHSQHPYPLMAPLVTPRPSCFCTSMAKIITGKSTIAAAA